MNLIDMDRLRKELMAKGDIPIHEVFNTIWEQPIVNICEVEDQQPCEDCISREAVEKITWEEPSYTDALNVLTEVREKIRQLPSVTPKPCEEENPNCTECRYYDKEKHHCLRFCRVIENTIAEITSEQTRPKGKWSRPSVVAMPYTFAYECPICRQWGNIQTFKPNYCPNCGAKMEVEE